MFYFVPLKLAPSIRDFEESTYRCKITTRCTAAKTKQLQPSAHFDIVLRAVEPSRTLHSKINCTVSTWQTVRWQPLNVKQHPIESQSIQYLKASSRRVHRLLRTSCGMWCSMCTSQCPQKTLEAERHRQRERERRIRATRTPIKYPIHSCPACRSCSPSPGHVYLAFFGPFEKLFACVYLRFLPQQRRKEGDPKSPTPAFKCEPLEMDLRWIERGDAVDFVIGRFLWSNAPAPREDAPDWRNS